MKKHIFIKFIQFRRWLKRDVNESSPLKIYQERRAHQVGRPPLGSCYTWWCSSVPGAVPRRRSGRLRCAQSPRHSLRPSGSATAAAYTRHGQADRLVTL